MVLSYPFSISFDFKISLLFDSFFFFSRVNARFNLLLRNRKNILILLQKRSYPFKGIFKIMIKRLSKPLSTLIFNVQRNNIWKKRFCLISTLSRESFH